MAQVSLFVNQEVSAGAWTVVGTSPYLNTQNQPTAYIHSPTRNANSGVYGFANSSDLGTINSVRLYIYAVRGGASTDFTTYLNSTNTGLQPPAAWGWVYVDVSSILTTWAAINAATIYFDKPNTTNNPQVDAAYLLVDYSPTPVAYSESRAGVETPSGQAQRGSQLARMKDGAITFAGNAASSAFAYLMGAVSYVYQGAAEFFGQSGTFSLAGNLFRSLAELARTKTGDLLSTGNATRASVLARLKDGVLNLSATVVGVITGTLGSVTADGILDLYGRITLIDTVLRRLTAATLSLTGILRKSFTRSKGGVISFAGRATALIPGKELVGYIYRLIDIAKTKAGAIDFSGIVSSFEGQLSTGFFQGTLDLVGAVTNDAVKIFTNVGQLVSSGVLRKVASLGRLPSGVLNYSGVFSRKAQVSHLYDGVLSFAGNLYRLLSQATYSGAVDFTGEVLRSAFLKLWSISSSLDSAGDVLRLFTGNRTKDGSLTLSGLVNGVWTNGVNFWYWELTSGISLAGATLIRLLDSLRNLGLNQISLAGSLAWYPERWRTFLGSLDITGVARRWIVVVKTASGTVTIAGLLYLLKQFRRTQDAVLDLAGAISYVIDTLRYRYKTGELSLVGTLSNWKDLSRTPLGNITPSGILTRLVSFFRTVSDATVSFVGELEAAFIPRDWPTAILTMSGIVTPYLISSRPVYASALNITGVVTRSLALARTRIGEKTLTGSLPNKYKDALYYGPEREET